MNNDIPNIDTVLTELRALRGLIEARLSPPHRALSIAESAKHLGVSESFLRKGISAGKITATRQGRRVTIPAAEIERLQKQGV